MSKIELNGVEYDADNLTLPTDHSLQSAWTAPDADGVVSVDWSKARTNFRADAFLPKSLFLRGLITAGILPESEALDAAKGNWPATFSAALSSLSSGAQFEAQINWAAATKVTRNDPLLEILRAKAGVAHEVLDTMFGYTGQ